MVSNGRIELEAMLELAVIIRFTRSSGPDVDGTGAAVQRRWALVVVGGLNHAGLRLRGQARRAVLALWGPWVTRPPARRRGR